MTMQDRISPGSSEFVNACYRKGASGFFSYANHYVAHIEMGHFPGLGLTCEKSFFSSKAASSSYSRFFSLSFRE